MPAVGGHMTPLKAIRAKCLDCSAYSAQEVRLCPVEKCALYPWRFGKRPSTIQKRKQLKKPLVLQGTVGNSDVLMDTIHTAQAEELHGITEE